MKETLETLAARMDGLGARMQGLDARMDGLGGRIDRLGERMELGFKHVEERFDRIDERFEQVDRRFQDIDQRSQEVKVHLSKLAIGQDHLREDLKRGLDGYGSLVDKDHANVKDHEMIHDTLDSHHVRITLLESSRTRPLKRDEPQMRSGPALVNREKDRK